MNVAVYALCLDDRPDRQANVERELRRVGLEHEVFLATRPTEAAGFSSPGRRGCFESHLSLLRRALDAEVDMAVFCQDDLWIAHTFTTAWPSILATIETMDWQFINLSYMPHFYPSVDAGVVRVGPHVGRLEAFDLLCAHFYAVHRSVLPDLIAFLEDILENGPRRPHDGALNDFRRDRGYYPLVALPNLGEQMPSPSNITPSTNPLGRAMHSVGALKPVLAVYRAMFRFGFETASRFRMHRPDRAVT